MKIRKFVMFTAAGLLLLHVAYAAAHYTVNVKPLEKVYAEDFGGQPFSENKRVHMEICCDTSMRLEAPDGGDDIAAVFRLHPDDALVKKSKRSEYRLPAGKFGVETWYRIRTYLPEDWQVSEVPVTIYQWHGVPDKILFEGNRPPPLRLLFKDNDWYIPLSSDTRILSNPLFNMFGQMQGEILWKAPAPRNEWEDWVFRVHWSTKDDGRLTIWRNGEIIAEHSGPNAYRDLAAPYLKLGVYVPRWKTGAPPGTAAREMYFDDVWEVYPGEADSLPPDVAELLETYRATEISRDKTAALFFSSTRK